MKKQLCLQDKNTPDVVVATASCLSKVVAVIQAKSEGCGELRNTEQGSEVDNKYAQQINVEYVG